MTQLYIPLLKDCLRLTQPLVVPLTPGTVYCENRYAGWRVNHGEAPCNHAVAQGMVSFELEAGTVLQVRRYFVSVQARRNEVQMHILASPRRDLMMRKYGGTGTIVKLELPLELMNTIHYEKVTV